jgi:predicted phage terminase large subunit-like protein
LRYGTVTIWTEQEPGSGGLESAQITVRSMAGYDVRAERVTGDKEARARPFAAQAEAGNVSYLLAPWNVDYFDELESFPMGKLKDQVDASSGAFNKLARVKKGPMGQGAY